ncbi:hypothetical protein GOP47_0024619 [Adiantum capillus-veneris]|uniref:Glycine-rich protein n=1 Tax=Adiantum capillus-veneris TaxID=13818 RepID=A0A9D4U257_ADICA|nr:hypothetical protein GOP47_0024619 [Adiantum capillus-veneris]
MASSSYVGSNKGLALLLLAMLLVMRVVSLATAVVAMKEPAFGLQRPLELASPDTHGCQEDSYNPAMADPYEFLVSESTVSSSQEDVLKRIPGWEEKGAPALSPSQEGQPLSRLCGTFGSRWGQGPRTYGGKGSGGYDQHGGQGGKGGYNNGHGGNQGKGHGGNSDKGHGGHGGHVPHG